MGTKISAMAASTNPPNTTDLLAIVQGGATKRTTLGALFTQLLSFTQSGTLQSLGTVAGKLSESVSVRDQPYGADPSNSAAANTTAFNAALAANTVVYVPGGPGDVYDLTALTALTTSKIIWGNGATLRFNTTGDGITFSQASSVQNKIGRVIGLTFANVTNTPGSYIKNNGFLNFVVEKCRFSDCAATYCIDNLKGYGMQVRDCVFSD